MNGPKLQFAACPKHCHGGQKTSSSSLNGYTPPIQGGRANFPTITIMSMAKKIPPNSQFRNQNINKNSSADWSVWKLRGKTIKTKEFLFSVENA